jgi:hypothetical protein
MNQPQLDPNVYGTTAMDASDMGVGMSLIAYDEILNTARPDIDDVGKACALLLAFAAGYFALGWLRFRKIEV